MFVNARMPVRSARHLLVVLLVAECLLGTRQALAHPLSVSYSRFVATGRRLAATVRLPLDDMDLLLRLDRDLDGTVSDGEIAAGRPAIDRYLAERVTVSSGGAVLRQALQDIRRWHDRDGFPYLEATSAYSLPASGVEWSARVRVLTDLYGDHRTLAEIVRGERRDEFLFQHGSTFVATAEPVPFWRTAGSFIAFGIEHIFTGYDHILFLFGLLLVGRGLRNLVAVVTSFTVAHSLTLSIAALGWFEPVPWTVEAAIALSVAYIGIENLFVRDVGHRWRITFAFGLIHGFGFANVLREMDLPPHALAISLFTFNLGVEIGQVLIVALMLPVLRFLERQPYRRPIVRVTSGAIAVVGLVWFYQRVT